MKKPLITSLFLVMGLIAWSCNRPTPVFPTGMTTPTPSPTATSTATATPVCGFTQLPGTSYVVNTLPGGPVSVTSNGPLVIQNEAQWTYVNVTAPATPPVDFSTQMILEVPESLSYDICQCSLTPPSITSVCFYSDSIVAHYLPIAINCAPVILNGQLIPPTCNTIVFVSLQAMAAVPQSSLPVTWITP
jgi:hypothetical protein